MSLLSEMLDRLTRALRTPYRGNCLLFKMYTCGGRSVCLLVIFNLYHKFHLASPVYVFDRVLAQLFFWDNRKNINQGCVFFCVIYSKPRPIGSNSTVRKLFDDSRRNKNPRTLQQPKRISSYSFQSLILPKKEWNN